MKNPKLFLSPLFLLAAFSCNPKKAEFKQTVDRFATMECRAIALRENRFMLADKMRFTQDSLTRVTNPTDTLRLHNNLSSYHNEKERMLKQSLLLADSIQSELKELMKEELKSRDDKMVFDQMLNKALAERGCVNKS